MTEWIFDTPYWVLGVLVAGAAALFVAGNNRQDKPLKRLALAALGLAIALAITSYLVDTDREKVGKKTREFVGAVEKKDTATVERLLHPSADLRGMHKKEIVRAAGEAVDAYHLKDVRISSMDVRSTGDTIIAVINVGANVEVGGFGGGVPSTWQLTWVKTEAGWQVQNIDALSLPFADINAVLSRFRK